MIKKNEFYIFHIRDSINKIDSYTEKYDFSSFNADSIIQDAVIRQFEIIGEASSKLSEDFKFKNKNIPWKEIIGMRNKLIHDYFGVNIKFVWETIKQDIPGLKTEIENIIKNLDPQIF
jgi:uncharacterized protein with HEPN domain